MRQRTGVGCYGATDVFHLMCFPVLLHLLLRASRVHIQQQPAHSAHPSRTVWSHAAGHRDEKNWTPCPLRPRRCRSALTHLCQGHLSLPEAELLVTHLSHACMLSILISTQQQLKHTHQTSMHTGSKAYLDLEACYVVPNPLHRPLDVESQNGIRNCVLKKVTFPLQCYVKA